MQIDDTMMPHGETMRGGNKPLLPPLSPAYPEHKIESHPSPDLDALWESIRKIAEGS